MIRIFHRQFTNTRHSFTYLARSTINPIDFQLRAPTNFTPKSLLVLSTPTNLPQVIEDSIKLYQEQNVELVVAGVDTVVPYSHRNGVAELWMDEPMHIGNSLLLEERDDINKPPPESDGLNAVSARKNWKNIQSNLKIKLRHEVDANLNLANTVFSTGSIITLFYFGKGPHSGQHLCDLEISLPREIVPRHSRTVIEDSWTDLYPGESFKITNCIGNLIKKVDDNPAAKYLEDNEELMSIGSKETEVFVKIKKPNTSKVERFKVIAGGGGWGPKADIIALSPEAKLEKGSEVKFFMVTPEDRYLQKHNDDDIAKYQNAITFTNSYEETGYNSDNSTTEKEHVYENVFGCGSEQGFFLNGIKHNSPGESASIKL
ncbi:hypothetical protein SBY92_002567 [Candida maltosa Xu316]|uniref:FIST domain-containing protein n=1 Tax=Candida maltosa (strain Xu316) TaxID=1245528 RepID=M3J3B4_CANMX|nr:hypothetical protein G210_3365 [Candida maltosa Xu316]